MMNKVSCVKGEPVYDLALLLILFIIITNCMYGVLGQAKQEYGGRY
jgi:hypothetical protein